MFAETGYCGFGDTCKFLHDRGTCEFAVASYRRRSPQLADRLTAPPDLAGWQLDKLAANPRKDAAEDASDTDSDDEDVPFACLICRKPYTDPVVTRCEHYFCSACAIKRFAKTPKCAACGAPTGGIFNRADKVIAKLKKAKESEGADADVDRDGRDEGEGARSGGAGGVRIEGLSQGSGDEGSEDEDED